MFFCAPQQMASILGDKKRELKFHPSFKTIRMKRENERGAVILQKGEQDILLDYAELRKAALVLRAINHRLRQHMIDLLEQQERMTVTDIYVKMRLEQSVASQHLAILRRAGVVQTERVGKFIFYSLDKNRIGQISLLVEELAA
jgi:DNA-binding transcriptional ArsR family regulator